jgi:hypothetical protein
MIYVELENHSIVAMAKDGIIDFSIKVPTVAEKKVQKISCFYFSHVSLHPVYVADILISSSPGKYFNKSFVRGDSFYHGPLLYTYGQVGYLRGSPSIRCVLLNKLESEQPIEAWEYAAYMPEIWKQFNIERP